MTADDVVRDGHRVATFTYFAPTTIEVARVDARCVVQFCSAVERAGQRVRLVAMRIKTRPDETKCGDPLDLYGVDPKFEVVGAKVPVDQDSGDSRVAISRLVVHCPWVVRVLWAGRTNGATTILTKSYGTARLLLAGRRLLRSRATILFEVHVPPTSASRWSVLRRADGIIANTAALARALSDHPRIDGSRVLPTHQGIEASALRSTNQASEHARKALGLPIEHEIVVYTGKAYYGYAEVEYLLETAGLLAARGTLFLIVGGRADQVLKWRARVRREGLENVEFVGFVPPTKIATYQAAADVLTLYYPSGDALNSYRSPGKLFEYMASRRPIVAVDLPVLREVLGEDPAAIIVPPDQPAELARMIAAVLENPELARSTADRAHERVKQFTWDARAKRVLDFSRAVGG